MSAIALLLLYADLSEASAIPAEASFVTQLRLETRGSAVETFAERGSGGVTVERRALAALGILVPPSETGDQVQLSAIPTLRYREDSASASIILECDSECFQPQILSGQPRTEMPAVTPATGGYLTYDADVQWVSDDDFLAAGLAEAALFGRWGLLESSWIASNAPQTDDITRLETRWTLDRPQDRMRISVGDSVAPGIAGSATRFAGVQITRSYAFTPDLITYPTPVLSGEADAASTVELYVDGALRARNEVEAGPFVFEAPPLVSGAGETQLVVTDVLGRRQVTTRPFFVSTDMLRPRFSAWSIAFGSERFAYGLASASYGAPFFAGHYRRGMNDWLTADAALELADDLTNVQLGATLANAALGQVRIGYALNGEGASATTLAWFRNARIFSFGLQYEAWDEDFHVLGRNAAFQLRRAAAGNIAVNLGDAGTASLTAAEIISAGSAPARVYTLAYAPDWAAASLSFRAGYVEQEKSELNFGVNLSFSLRDNVSAQASADFGSRSTYTFAAQESPDAHDRFGWRARAATGAYERADVGASYRSALGESTVDATYGARAHGIRAGHSGSIGWIDGYAFAGPPIRGSFAVVDAGAPDVSVTRDGLWVGDTGADGRVLATNLRAYDRSTIAIAPDDLPLDRAPANTASAVTPGYGAGVVVRFEQAREQLQETQVLLANGQPAPRGAVLVRARDGARFPIASDGRVVLFGASDGDIVHLEAEPACTASADAASADAPLTLHCATMS